ncbi:hypothetical protein J132_02729 [Termitomyces sp. J132]|nr:hypothetical protein J132_02729 [Termitomyces sp. J132]
MDKCPDFKVSPSTAGLLTLAAAKAGLPKPAVAKAGPSRSATVKAGTAKLANPVVIATLIAFSANVLQGSEAKVIEVLKLRTYVIPTALFYRYFPPVHWDPHNEEFFVTQVQAAQAAMSAPVASDLGSNDDDDVPTSKQCILDSDSEDNTAEWLGDVTTRSPKPRTSSIKPPNPQKDPQRSAELPPMPTPTSANSDTSPANSDGPLANFGACPAATDTYPGLPKPREPPPLFLIFAHPSLTQHPASSDLFRNITTTSEQPAIPSTYQRGTIFDHNRHPPTPSSPAKPRRHSRRTPKSSGSQYISHRVALRTLVLILLNVTYVSRSYLSLPVLSRPLFVIVLVIVSYLHSNLLLFHNVSSNAVSVTSSDPCAQFFINPNDLTNSAIIITNPDTPYQVRTSLFARSQTPSTPNDLPSNPGSAPIDHTATYSLASANLPYGLLLEPRQDRLISPQSDFSGPSRTCLDHISPITRANHQDPERLRVSGHQCRGITPA